MKYLPSYIEYLTSLGYAQSTLSGMQKNIQKFREWVGIEDERRITQEAVQLYCEYVKTQLLCESSMNIKMRSIKKYFKFQTKHY